MNNKKSQKYHHKTKKIFKCRSQGTTKSSKRYLTKINVWRKNICTLFSEQGITIVSTITAIFMTTSKIVLCYYRCIWRRESPATFDLSPSKDKWTSKKKWLNKLADALKRLLKHCLPLWEVMLVLLWVLLANLLVL